jgi:CheY-like chemotaxis protein
MSQTTINQLPLIVADEKEAMLNSIVNLLRQRGFVVVVEKQMPQVQPQTEIKEMDALSILRFVDEAWQQEIPVVILTQQPATVAPTYRLAA